MHKRLRSDVAIQGTRIVGKLIGKGFTLSEINGRVDEKYIIEVDMTRITLQDVLPFLRQIAVDPKKIAR